MNYRYRVLAAFSLLLISICISCTKVENGPFREVTTYWTETVATELAAQIHIRNEKGRLEIYTHKHETVIFEISARTKGTDNASELKKALTKELYNIENHGCLTVFRYPAKGIRETPEEVYMDIVVHIPDKTDNLLLDSKEGSIVVYDDMHADIKAYIGDASIRINRMNGKLEVKGKKGDIAVLGGRLDGGSQVVMERGNLLLDTEYTGECLFKTGIGNITATHSVQLEQAVRLETDLGEVVVKHDR